MKKPHPLPLSLVRRGVSQYGSDKLFFISLVVWEKGKGKDPYTK
jgi:hypothetical protein